jgi:hypothetical protein
MHAPHKAGWLLAVMLLLPIALCAVCFALIRFFPKQAGEPSLHEAVGIALYQFGPITGIICAGVCGYLVGRSAPLPSEQITRALATAVVVFLLYGAVSFAGMMLLYSLGRC